MSKLMEKFTVMLAYLECRGYKRTFMPSPPESISDFPMAAASAVSAQSAEGEEYCTLSLFEEFVQERSQSTDITSKYNDIISVLINMFCTCLDLELPA